MAILAIALSAPAAAQDVTYRSISKTSFSGPLGAVMDLVGGATETEQVQYISGGKMRTDNENSSTIMDMESGRMLILNHEQRTYIEWSLDDMMGMAEDVAGNMEESMDEAREEAGEEAPEANMSFQLDIDRPGDRERIAGYEAERIFMTVESQLSAESEDGTNMSGRFFVFSDMWISDDAPGYEAMTEFAGSERMQARAQSMGGSLAAAFQQNPNQQAAFEAAAEEMAKVDGMPLRTTTHMVIVPEGQEFDRDAALAADEDDGEGVSAGDALSSLAGGLFGRKDEPEEPEDETGSAQMTLFKVVEEVTEIDTSPIPADVFEIPEGYRRIEMGEMGMER